MELTNDFRVSAAPPKAWQVLTDVERIAPMLPGAQLQEIEGDEYRGVVKVKVGPITAQYKGAATFQERDEKAGRVVLKAQGRDTRGQGNASALITATMTPDGEGTKVSVVTDLTVTGKVAQFGRGVLAEVSAKLLGQFADALEADLDKEGDAGGVAAVDGTAEVAAGGGADGEPAAGGSVVDGAGEATAAAAAGSGGVTADADASADAKASAEAAEQPAGAGQPAASGSASGSTVRRVDHPEPEPVDLIDAAGGSVVKRVLPVLAVLAIVVVLLRLRGRRRRA